MPEIIKDAEVVEDSWILLDDKSVPDQKVPAGKVIVPVSVWLAQAEDLCQRDTVGVWLDSDEPPRLIAEQINRFSLIAINFPVFTDGRGYSYARLLRDRFGYRGELRAIGDVLRDQLYYMSRCGFNAFQLRAGLDVRAAVASLADFSEGYQAAVDQPVPLFRRRPA